MSVIHAALFEAFEPLGDLALGELLLHRFLIVFGSVKGIEFRPRDADREDLAVIFVGRALLGLHALPHEVGEFSECELLRLDAAHAPAAQDQQHERRDYYRVYQYRAVFLQIMLSFLSAPCFIHFGTDTHFIILPHYTTIKHGNVKVGICKKGVKVFKEGQNKPLLKTFTWEQYEPPAHSPTFSAGAAAGIPFSPALTLITSLPSASILSPTTRAILEYAGAMYLLTTPLL